MRVQRGVYAHSTKPGPRSVSRFRSPASPWFGQSIAHASRIRAVLRGCAARAKRSSNAGSHVSLWKLVEWRTIRVCAAGFAACLSNSGTQYLFATIKSG